ncbi:MAG: MFS transporter [Bacteroidota bacterium]
MDANAILKKNFRYNLLEGTLYLSTNPILYAPVFFPALIRNLGGGSLAVGAFPVMVYLVYFLPQVFAAHYATTMPFRKPFVVRWGMVQRMLVLFLGVVIGMFGASMQTLALFGLFVLFSLNQAAAAITAPAWFDLVVKTTTDTDRGKLMGLRTASGSILGLVNSAVLTYVIGTVVFPLNYAAIILLMFMLQSLSLVVLNRVEEVEPSPVREAMPLSKLYERIKAILENDAVFRQFLISAALLTIGLMPFGFFLIAAMTRYSLGESYVGWFTSTIVFTQIFSGVALGYLADRYGHRFTLLICATATCGASLVALASNNVWYYFVVFFMVGVNLSLELITRYNFAVDCAPENDRPMYIGLMNAWLAPWYCFSFLGGWVVDEFGYEVVFGGGLVFAVIGIVVLVLTPDPRRAKLALSSK